MCHSTTENKNWWNRFHSWTHHSLSFERARGNLCGEVLWGGCGWIGWWCIVLNYWFICCIFNVLLSWILLNILKHFLKCPNPLFPLYIILLLLANKAKWMSCHCKKRIKSIFSLLHGFCLKNYFLFYCSSIFFRFLFYVQNNFIGFSIRLVY